MAVCLTCLSGLPAAETAVLVREFVLSLRRDYPDQYAALVPQLTAELQQKLANIS